MPSYAKEASLWPSQREMKVVRAIMLGGVALIGVALLRHCEKFFDATALAILASTGLLYCATHLKYLRN